MNTGDLAGLTVRLYGRVRESIVDGPGIRYVVFAQGCPRSCEGCHNKESQPIDGGELVSVREILEEINKGREILTGITLSGGEPFSQAQALAAIARAVRPALTVWTFTGYTLEEILKGSTAENCWMELLRETDVLVDGPFMLEKRTLSTPFVGSSNQRIINLHERHDF